MKQTNGWSQTKKQSFPLKTLLIYGSNIFLSATWATVEMTASLTQYKFWSFDSNLEVCHQKLCNKVVSLRLAEYPDHLFPFLTPFGNASKMLLRQLTHFILVLISYRNQSLDMLCKSNDWFRYERQKLAETGYEASNMFQIHVKKTL